METCPPIIVKVYDDDTFGSDFMGSTVVDVEKGLKEGYINFNKTENPDPKWMNLKISIKILFKKDYFLNIFKKR